MPRSGGLAAAMDREGEPLRQLARAFDRAAEVVAESNLEEAHRAVDQKVSAAWQHRLLNEECRALHLDLRSSHHQNRCAAALLLRLIGERLAGRSAGTIRLRDRAGDDADRGTDSRIWPHRSECRRENHSREIDSAHVADFY